MFSSRVKRLHYPVQSTDDQSSAERKAALEVIRHATDHCHAEDMRMPKVYDALHRLSECVTPNRQWTFRRFRRALEINDSFDRAASVTVAYEAICRLIYFG